MSLTHDVNVSQKVIVSSLNSTVANINAGITWAGAAEDSVNTTGIQTIFKANRDCILYIDQGVDPTGAVWLITDSWSVAANTGDARTVLSAAPYFRVRIKNSGLTPTTSLVLATGLTPILSVLPKSLKEQGGLFTTTNQDVVADPNNSSIVALGAGNTFTGVASSTLGVVGIQVSLKSDQNCNVFIDQSPDGIYWDIVDQYIYYSKDGGNGWTVQALNSYVRVRVTNLNTVSAQTYLRLQTALCPMVEAVPRTLTQYGNFKTAVNEINGYLGSSVDVSPMNQMKTSEIVRLVGTAFSGTTFDTNFWTKTSQAGLGDATVSGGQMILATGTPTANGSIIVNSVQTARYVPANSNYYRANIRCPASTGVNTRRWGAFDANEGFFFEFDGATLSLVCRKSASDANKVLSGSFNGRGGDSYNLDTNVHTYEIYWTNKSAYFVIDDTMIHKFTGSTATLTSTLHLKVGVQCTNSGGNTNNNTLEVRSGTINRIGKAETAPSYQRIGAASGTYNLKYGPGRLHRIVNGVLNNNTVTVYDNTVAGAPIIATLNTNSYWSFEFGLDFYTGLTIVTTNNAQILTVVYE